jgi:hypothetical protein
LNHFTRPINFIKILLFLARTADPHPARPGKGTKPPLWPWHYHKSKKNVKIILGLAAPIQ